MNSEPEPSPLQFENAEYAGPGAQQACKACGMNIRSTYYEAVGNVLCEGCAEALRSPPQAGWFRRGSAALALGLLAAALGAGIYFGVTALTGYELSLIAIAVGAMVGAAVRWGCGGRGGWFYQLLAVGLTYFAISESYMLLMLREYVRSSEAFVSSLDEGSVSEMTSAPADGAPADSLAHAATAAGEEDTDAPPLLVVLGFLLIGSLALPVLMGIESPIGALIVAFGLFQAWAMNRRPNLGITGPFTIAARPPPPPPVTETA